MITRLTSEQEARLAVIRDEWMRAGLCTDPADRPAAEQGIRAAYSTVAHPPPRFILWLGSPRAGAIAQAVAPLIIAEMTGCEVDIPFQVPQAYRSEKAQMARQVETQVGDQVYWPVYHPVQHACQRVKEQVRDEVHRLVDRQVWDQLRDQARRGLVDRQVWDQVRDQVHLLAGREARDEASGQVNRPRWSWWPVDEVVRGWLMDWDQALILGQFGASSDALSAAMEAVGVTGLERYHGRQIVARSAGWWWGFRELAVVTDRPCVLHQDADGRLHSADGMAIAYPDGWGFWCWHGRRVPQWVIEEPSIDRIAAEANVEIRRCAIEALGWERFISDARLSFAGACPDPGNPGMSLELYDVPERLWGGPVRVLLAWNGTPELDGNRRRFGLTVPADIQDPLAAAAWTYDDPSSPVRMTPELYKTITRRT